MESSLPILAAVAGAAIMAFLLFFIYNAIDQNNIGGEREHNPWPMTLLAILFYPFIAIWVGIKYKHRPIMGFGILLIVATGVIAVI